MPQTEAAESLKPLEPIMQLYADLRNGETQKVLAFIKDNPRLATPPNESHETNETLAEYAFQHGHMEMFRELVTHHKALAPDKYGKRDVANIYEDFNIAYMINDTAETLGNAVYKNGETYAHSLAQQGKTEPLIALLKTSPQQATQTDIYDYTIAHEAARRGNRKLLFAILDAAPELADKQTIRGDTIAHLATMSGNTAMVLAIADDYPHLIHQTNHNDNTIAHLAAQHGHFEALAAILQRAPELAVVKNQHQETVHVNMQTQVLASSHEEAKATYDFAVDKTNLNLLNHSDTLKIQGFHSWYATTDTSNNRVYVSNTAVQNEHLLQRLNTAVGFEKAGQGFAMTTPSGQPVIRSYIAPTQMIAISPHRLNELGSSDTIQRADSALRQRALSEADIDANGILDKTELQASDTNQDGRLSASDLRHPPRHRNAKAQIDHDVRLHAMLKQAPLTASGKQPNEIDLGNLPTQFVNGKEIKGIDIRQK